LQVCRSNPEQRGRYIKIILALLQSRSTAVVYECAVTLTTLSSAPTAVRAAANCFCQLLVSQSDNNVKLIVLDRLQARSRGCCYTPQSCCVPASRSPHSGRSVWPGPPPAQELKDRHREVVQEVMMDMLRALSTPNLDVRKKTLDIALDLITARNIDEVRWRALVARARPVGLGGDEKHGARSVGRGTPSARLCAP
jgi:coatomer subunit beta